MNKYTNGICKSFSISYLHLKPKSVIRNTKNRGQTCNVLKMSYLQNHFSNGGH